MKSFFKFSEKNSKKPGKIVMVFLLVLMSFSFLVIQPKPVQAQLVTVSPTTVVGDALRWSWEKISNAFEYLWKKGGSVAFQQTLRTVLNKVAIDSANYVGSGGQGQKPLFITNPKSYVENLGDEAAGAFLENFANNMVASSNCDKIKKCQAGCSGDTTCLNNCGTCDTCTSKKTACKNSCDKMYRNTVSAMVNSSRDVSRSDAKGFSSIQLDECNQNCNTICTESADSTSLTNSIATPSFNVCQPSSIDAKLRITLGLAEQSRAQGPDCKATDIVKNWSNLDNYGNSVKALKDLYDATQGGYNDQTFLNDIQGVFDPRGNDFGIYLTAKTDSAALADKSKLSGTTNLISKGGWLDSLDIAGNTKSVPNQAEINTEQSYKQYSDNFGKYTGDAFVDALNTFLSQTAFTAFNTLMQNLGKTSTSGSTSNSQDYSNSLSNPDLGEGAVKEETSKLNKPDFGSQTNYDILSLLAMCQNEKKPGPTDCVIDNKLMQAITEHKTVMEAVKDGSLNGEWRLTSDNVKDAYTLRNISILRKYRILPVGWEVAIQKAKANNVSVMTLNDLLSCFKDDPSYKKFSRNFNQNSLWCRDLVDPNWVLKAPLNSCRKEGIGGQILSDSVTPGFKGINGQPDTLSAYNVDRADNYCADEQTCIKEKNNGNCDAYGYCTDEKRTWDFNSDSCQPINNTCRTFIGGASAKTASYLENTLDYSNCNANSAGCRQYSYDGAYSNGTVNWNIAKSIYLNSNVVSCDQSAEGCTGLIRIKSGSEANLIIDSDFSAETAGASSTGGFLNSWPIKGSGNSQRAMIVDNSSEPRVNSKALKLEIIGTSVEVYSNGLNSPILPQNLQIIPGQAYTLTADVYLADGDKAQVSIGSGNDLVSNGTSEKNSWQTIKVTRSPKDSFNSPVFSVGASASNGPITVFIRNIKFEASNVGSNYSAYGATKVYEKLLPNYLEAACYVAPGSDYRLKDNSPELSAICNKFARKCNQDEVGCELYSSTASQFNVAAKVGSSDLCPEKCLDYDIYISRLGSFNSAQSEKIIPATAKKCSAEEVGCSEFTNLDSLSQGGENKEYYSELKQCIKPSTSDCAAFYAWEGTDNGYQLKSYTLKKGADGGPAVTLTNSEESLKCNSIIYHSSISSPSYNSDCVEFYNVAGQITYHLVSKTITCSENCHSYRLTEKNIDPGVSQAQCTGSDRIWDVQNNGCQVCLNGGTWSATHNACIYQAIPSEGKTCQAASKDCREYNGSNGEVVRLISASDFENTNNWSSNCSNGLSISKISNVNNGKSLLYNNNASQCSDIGTLNQTTISRSHTPLIKQILADSNVAAQLNVGQSVKQGLAYNISFLAKAAQDTSLEIYFYNKETGQRSLFKSEAIKGGNEWKIYKANLENLDHVVSNNEILVVSGNGNFYFDNFVLNEISERYYLIKGTSVVPPDCSYDNFGTYMGDNYNLGCRAYTNRTGGQVNLRQFSKLCDESGVGCEQMIDTKNSSSGGASHLCNGTNCADVAADTAIYAVYDSSKKCNSVDAGCSRLGQLTKTVVNTNANVATKYLWTDVYERNNPDNYQSTLCGALSVGCEKWTNEDGLTYFKDPGDKTCVYKSHKGTDDKITKNWYQSPERRCDMNKDGVISNSDRCDSNNDGKIDNNDSGTCVCLKDSECNIGNNGATCILDNNDYPCSVSYTKTFGLGGVGNEIPVPNQAGLCEAKESSCTEYIDPVSSIVSNLVYNSSYQPVVGEKEGWTSGRQTFELEAHKLYIFKVEPAGAGATTLTFTDDVQVLSPVTNTLGAGTRNLTISGGQSILFYTSALNSILNPNSGNLINVTVNNPDSNKNIIVKPAIVDYQLKTNIDTETKSATCNNGENIDQGCILFNQRNINGAYGFATLNNYTNRLIKVKPNRVCSKWLSCVTYIQEPGATAPTCYALGECDRLSDDNKQCANFVSTDNNARTFDVNRDKNASGYSLMDKYYFSQMKEVGFNSDFHYDFEDLVPYLSCAREGTNTPCSFANNKNIIKELLVREKTANDVNYPAHGKSYLKVPAGYLISPQIAGTGVSLIPNRDYYLNFLINTRSSGVGGKVHIKYKDKDNKTANFVDLPDSLLAPSTTLFNASSGWERKILKFRTADDDKYIYRVELGTDSVSQSGMAYFDDLNIEQVLQVADSAYVARECRLYPETSSLTCNDSLARDGLEGYCLEHDLKNPPVCSLWYPVDHINSAVTGKATAGYNGSAPLSYCTQANGNFTLVEKRISYSLTADYSYDKKDGCDHYEGNYSIGFYPNDNDCADAGYSKEDYIPVLFEYPDGSGNRCAFTKWCVPRQKGAKLKFKSPVNNLWYETTQSTETSTKLLISASKEIPASVDQFGLSSINSASDGWYPYNGLSASEDKSADPAIRVYDYSNPPNNESGLKEVSGSDQKNNFRFTCDSFSQVVNSVGNNVAWSDRISNKSIYPTSTPLFFLDSDSNWYGGSAGLVEKRKSYLVKTSSSNGNCNPNNSHDGFNYKNTPNNIAYGVCNSFGYPEEDYVDFYYEYTINDCHQNYWCVPKLSGAKATYDNNQYNKHFSDTQPVAAGGSALLFPAAVSADGFMSYSDGWYLYNGLTPAEATNATPPIMIYDYQGHSLKQLSGTDSIYALSRYGRNRENIPFGAAVLPADIDLLSSETVKFRNQYSAKENESIFAGRPYGCFGSGCSNIGSCSLNPDVYCLVDPQSLSSTFDLNRKTCGDGGYGTCQPLWYKSLNGSISAKPDFENILKTLFLKTYSSYSYSYSNFSYASNGSGMYDFVQSGDNKIKECRPNSLIRPADVSSSSFCAIYPRITNVKLKLNGALVDNSVQTRGVYTLEFNTLIDPEQQPLKEIQIDWDAANPASSDIQVISGQDAKSSTSTPHIFYHYYKQSGAKNIEIKATDNWGFFGTFNYSS